MKALQKLVQRTSYKTKLMLWYLASVLLPILVGLIYLYNTTVAQAGQTLLATIHQRMEQERSGIQQTVSEIQHSAYMLSTQTDINRFFTLRYYDPVKLVETMNQEIMPTLSWFEAISKSIERFRFLTQNPYVPENEFMEHAARYAEEDWFQTAFQASKSNSFYSEPLHAARDYLYVSNSEAHVYSWFYPLLMSNAENTTLLEVSVNAGRLFRDIDKMPIAESGFLFTASRGILVQSGGLAEELRQWMGTEEGESLLQAGAEASRNIRLGNTSYYFSGLYIDELDTVLGCIVPAEEIDAPARAARNAFAAVSVAIILVIAPLSYLVATLLLKRIQRMLTAVKTIQQGNFDVRIPVHGQDEIDKLAGEINIMASQIDTLIKTVYVAETLEKESQLAALQAQINPHFLFNTLETLRMSAELGETDKLKTGLISLSRLMRYTLSATKEPVTLGVELQNLSYYMNIQEMLLDGRVRFTTDVPQIIRDNVKIMALTLQPIVENSILHGYQQQVGILEITLTVQRSQTGATICISDNGIGIREDELQKLREELDGSQPPQKPHTRGGIGLWNVNQRLVLTFGKASALQLTPAPGGGLTTSIFLPMSGTQREGISRV